MSERPYPKLLSDDEHKSLLARAERLWTDLQENNLGGYGGINRPFWIVAQFKAVIEEFGYRDIGQTWSKKELDAVFAKPDATAAGGEG